MTTSALPHPSAPRSSPALVAGIATLVVALAVAAGGAALVGVHGHADRNGFYNAGPSTLATPTAALVTDELDAGDDGPGWLFRKGRLATIRVAATPANGKPVFVGIARKSQVASYLDGVAQDRVTDFEVDPLSIDADRTHGRAAAAPPTEQRFWARSTTGLGHRSITWPVEHGTWSVVVMNADGTPGVRARVDVGAKVPLVFWLGIGLLAGGAVLGALGGAAVYRGRRQS